MSHIRSTEFRHELVELSSRISILYGFQLKEVEFRVNRELLDCLT